MFKINLWTRRLLGQRYSADKVFCYRIWNLRFVTCVQCPLKSDVSPQCGDGVEIQH